MKSKHQPFDNTENIQNFEAQYKRSTTQLLVLYQLSQKEMYAYDIIRETLIQSGNTYKMPLLYNILNKLEADAYIEQSRKIISENNRLRIYYKITEKGTRYLDELIDSYKTLSTAVNNILSKKGD